MPPWLTQKRCIRHAADRDATFSITQNGVYAQGSAVVSQIGVAGSFRLFDNQALERYFQTEDFLDSELRAVVHLRLASAIELSQFKFSAILWQQPLLCV